MKKILKWTIAWIVVCNIGLMGLNMLFLFSRPANAAPVGQAETQAQTDTQATLESRVAILEQQNRILDERLRRLEIMLGAVTVGDSSGAPNSNAQTSATAASPESGSSQLINNIPPQPAATAPQGPQPFTAYRSNVRWGPGTNYPIAIELGQNEPLDIIGYNNDSGKIWFKLASGPWIADFLVRNAPGAIPYITAPTQEEIANLQRSNLQPENEAIDATSDPPTLPSPAQSEISGSDSSSVPIEPTDQPGVTTSSATSFATSTATASNEAAATTVSGTGNGAVTATAEVTTEFNNLDESPIDTADTSVGDSENVAVIEPTPAALNTLPLIRRPTRPALNCIGGCTQYPAWCDPPIKGHLTFDGDEPIYYIPSHPEYSDIPMDIGYGERWFCTIEEAEAAGWRAP